jgi:hypothetical protein
MGRSALWGIGFTPPSSGCGLPVPWTSSHARYFSDCSAFAGFGIRAKAEYTKLLRTFPDENS